MTNGEKMQADFPGIRITLLESYVQVMGENYEFNNAYPLEWWNAEYKEPSSSEKPNLSKNLISSTTKNGISNRSIIYKAKESKDIQEDLEKLEKLNEPTTKNCESCRYYGLHHEVCNYCYKCSLWTEKEPTTKKCITCAYREIDGKPHEMCKSCVCGNRYREDSTTKNDLAVDCIDRAELLKAMDTYDKFGNDSNERLIFLSTPALQDRYVPYVHYDDMVNCVKGMSSVTPIRPKGHWIYDYTSADGHRTYHCSKCGCYLQPKHSEPLDSFKWCSLCGADMSEDKE